MSFSYTSDIIKNLSLNPITKDSELKRLLDPIHIAIFQLAATLSGGGGGGGGGGQTFYFQSTAPTFPPAIAGDEWLESDTGNYYKAVDDGSSLQWVEVGVSGGGGGGGIVSLSPPAVHYPRLWIDAIELCADMFRDTTGTLGPITTAAQTCGLWRGRNSFGAASSAALEYPRLALNQAVAANQPTWNTGLVNGFPGLSFDGSNDQMGLLGITESTTTWPTLTGGSTAAFATFSTTGFTAITVFTVRGAAVAGANPWQNGTIWGDSTGNIGLHVYSTGGINIAVMIYIYLGTTAYTAVVPTTINVPLVITCRWNTSLNTLQIRLNRGAWVNTTTVGRFSSNSGSYAMGYNGYNYGFFDIANHCLWPLPIYDADLALVENYLAGRVGLTLP